MATAQLSAPSELYVTHNSDRKLAFWTEICPKVVDRSPDRSTQLTGGLPGLPETLGQVCVQGRETRAQRGTGSILLAATA